MPCIAMPQHAEIANASRPAMPSLRKLLPYLALASAYGFVALSVLMI